VQARTSRLEVGRAGSAQGRLYARCSANGAGDGSIRRLSDRGLHEQYDRQWSGHAPGVRTDVTAQQAWLSAGCHHIPTMSEANSYSGWNRRVKQTATMFLPSILVKSSTRGRWRCRAGLSRRRGAAKGAVHAMHVVINGETHPTFALGRSRSRRTRDVGRRIIVGTITCRRRCVFGIGQFRKQERS
jgi:hypothetical protein